MHPAPRTNWYLKRQEQDREELTQLESEYQKVRLLILCSIIYLIVAIITIGTATKGVITHLKLLT
jgi:hypothetical protein